MKFAVGYQPPVFGRKFSEITAQYKDHLGEVFFPWVGAASGRPPILTDQALSASEAEKVLCRELAEFCDQGLALDLLLNANCYGEKAVSRQFEQEIRDIIRKLADYGCCPKIVTTTSLFVAQVIKTWFPEIEVRASVNMRIGTIQAMEYVSDLFDCFYLQRDYQRNLPYVRTIRQWCNENHKKLCLLANSGCLRFCPGQSFHDNLLAHCKDVVNIENVPGFNPHVCWKLYDNKENFAEILKATWIRPEDIYRYEGLVDTVKLATRQHSHPQSVIGAYVSGKWAGNLLDLLEPGFSPVFDPDYIDNTKFPPEFFERTSHCLNGCTACGYCEQVLQQVLSTYEPY